MIGTYRGIFHSALVTASSGDGIHLKIKSDIMKSKKPDKLDYVIVSHDGSEDQFLSLENDRCKNALRHKKGQSITIRATGSRADADIQILNSDGTVRAPEAPPSSSNREGGSGLPDSAKVAAQFEEAAMLALNTATRIRKRFGTMTDEQFQVITSSAIIYFDRQGVTENMPVKSAPTKSAAQAAVEDEVPF